MSKPKNPAFPIGTIRKGSKLCRGPKHPPEGEWVPLTNYHFHKSGKRKGKPFSRCRDCVNINKVKTWTGQHGLIPVNRVRFIFTELERRIGRFETIRRLGTSSNLWWNLDRNKYVRKSTVAKATWLLLELRQKNVRRHRASIKHGSAARGHKERTGRVYEDMKQ